MRAEQRHEPRSRRTAPKTRNELRCFCPRRTIMAMFGLDATGNLYLHIMVYKQHRIFGNILLRGGPVELQCRDCGRWHVINFTPTERPVVNEIKAPEEVELPPMFVRQANDHTHVAE